jgi:hypothetical protein
MFVIDGIAYADNPNPLLKVEIVRPLDDHTLWLRFNNDEERTFDMTPFLSTQAFSALADAKRFSGVYLVRGVPTWDGGIDIAPEHLYENGKAPRIAQAL